MSNKIFKSSFLASMLVLATSLIMIFSVLYNYFESRMFAELESEANYISYGVGRNENDFFKNFNTKNKRITIVAPDGTVLNDTKADPSTIENHAERTEIKNALKDGIGKSERYSDTLTEKTLYYAIRLENGNILRVSATQNSVIAIFLGLLQPIVAIIAAALVLSLFLSYKVSNSILKPINTIDLDSPESADTYEELAPLLQKLALQKKTIRRQIREAEKSREEFDLICENMNEGFLIIDKKERILSYNNAALQLLEIEELTDNHVLSFNRAKGFGDVIEKALSGQRAESTVQNEDRTYNLIANPVNTDKKTIGAVIVIIDITESSKREQLRREFTSNVSHELKTPLTSISGFAEMLKAGGNSDETVIDFSASIYAEAQRLISLVSDIMKISELDEGAIAFDTNKIDLYAMSFDISERLRPIAAKENISLTVSGAAAYVNGSAKIIDEMIYNLLDNAIKYNKPNGSVNISVTTADGKVRLNVCDTGIGIPQSEQMRVFERFYRVDKSRAVSAGGTGLGLAIVKHGSMYHNAKISLESVENKGTSITLEFNAAK